jgi:hypothetical protein
MDQERRQTTEKVVIGVFRLSEVQPKMKASFHCTKSFLYFLRRQHAKEHNKRSYVFGKQNKLGIRYSFSHPESVVRWTPSWKEPMVKWRALAVSLTSVDLSSCECEWLIYS